MDTAVFITTRNRERLRLWRKVFRSSRLPVKVAVPRWQRIDNQPQSVCAYDLDAGRLRPKQRDRFRRYVAKAHKVSLDEADGMLDGWPIPASQCEVVAESIKMVLVS